MSSRELAFLSLAAACSTPPPVVSVASAGEDSAAELEDFDPAQEVAQQPFESVNGLRGPALSINGLRLRGERGSVLLMVSAYEEGRDIVFQFLPREQAPPDWLAACPRSGEDSQEPGILVTLEGVGSLSHNVLQQPDFGWSTRRRRPSRTSGPARTRSRAIAMPSASRCEPVSSEARGPA